jgi:hypothetical protein
VEALFDCTEVFYNPTTLALDARLGQPAAFERQAATHAA